MAGTVKRPAVRGAKIAGVLLVTLAMAGAIYQQVGLARDAGLAPPPSEMVIVNGRRVHLVCLGVGPRTLVLDAQGGFHCNLR